MARRSSRLARGPIDYRSPLSDYAADSGRTFWWKSLPGRYGGPVCWDLVSRNLLTLTSIPAGYGWTPQGPPGGYGSIHLDGTSGYVTMPDAPVLRPFHLTVAASVLFNAFNTTAGNSEVVVCKPLYATGGSGWIAPYLSYMLRFNSTSGSSYLQFSISAASPSYSPLNATATISTGVWYRAYGSYDGFTQRCYLFQGHNLIASNSASVTGSISYNSTPLYFGTDAASSADGYDRSNCLIDDVFVANRAFRTDEIYLDNELSRQGYPGVIRRRRRVVYGISTGGATVNATLAASVSGTVALRPRLALSVVVDALASGSSAMSGKLSLPIQIDASSLGESSLRGSLSLPVQLVAAANAESTLAPSLALSVYLAADATGSSSLSASAGVGQLYARMEASASALAQLRTALSLSLRPASSGVGLANAAASLGLGVTLSAEAVGSSSLSASKGFSCLIEAAATSRAALHGSLGLSVSLSASAFGAASLSAYAASVVSIVMDATAVGSANLAGTVIAALGEPCFVFREPDCGNVFREPDCGNVFR